VTWAFTVVGTAGMKRAQHDRVAGIIEEAA
jgi:hypothetical protein